MGAAGTRLFPAPSEFSGDRKFRQNSRKTCGEIAKLWLFEN
jgi:hypothetical protein